MKVERFSLPKSSFLSIEKDMGIITDKVLSCDRLKKLLYYTTEDALDKPNLTIEQSNMLFGKNIKIFPPQPKTKLKILLKSKIPSLGNTSGKTEFLKRTLGKKPSFAIIGILD